MTGHGEDRINRADRKIVARDDEEIAYRSGDEDWSVSWRPPDRLPIGTPHGASGICVVADGGIVVISPDGEHWDVPGGRPEGNETWEETLRREVREEACAIVVRARLLGFSRGVCLAGPQVGRVIIRSLWRADVQLAPWEPQFEATHRRVVAMTTVVDQLAVADGLARIISRALLEASMV